jgi:hypothetical protein
MSNFQKTLEEIRLKMEAEMKAAEDMMNSQPQTPAQESVDATKTGVPASDASIPKKSSELNSALGAAKNTGKLHMTSAEHAVRRLNQKYALVHFGADVRISVDRGDSYDFWKLSSFREHMENDRVIMTTSRGSKEISAAEAWMKSGDRTSYERVDFSPLGSVPTNVLNLWRGFGVAKIEGLSLWDAARGCWRLLRHIRDNLCKGNSEEFKYFIRWCADLIQRPQIKGGVACAITGRKGTGKTKVAEALTALLGNHSTTVSQSRHLVGNFNAHLRQALLIVAEEAIWAGDKHAEGQLKHMITSADLVTEQKGVDVVAVKSLARIMFIGNDPWIFPANEDERRLFALECGIKHMRDFSYFRDIDVQLYGHVDGQQGNPNWKECMGIRSFMTFLSLVDLSKYSLRDIPDTSGLRAQRESSMESHVRFFRDCLANQTLGFIKDKDFDHLRHNAMWHKVEERIIPKREIYDDMYKTWHRSNYRSQPTMDSVFWKWVKKVFGWSTCKIGGKGSQAHAVKVTGWIESKDNFVKAMKIDDIEDHEEF